MAGSESQTIAELTLLATQVEAEGQVELGQFDEGELLALGLYPMGRGRVEQDRWPPYLGLTGGVDHVLASAIDHPEVQAAGRRLAARGLAIAIPRDGEASARWRAISSAHRLQLLYGRSRAAFGWFSGSILTTTKGLSATGLNGAIIFGWLNSDAGGLCLILSLAMPDEPDPAQPHPVQVSVARPEIAAQHIIQAIYRQPLTTEEKATTSGTHCKVLLQYDKGETETTASWDLWHEWDASIVYDLPAGSSPPRRGFFASRKSMLDADSVASLFTKLATGFVERHG